MSPKYIKIAGLIFTLLPLLSSCQKDWLDQKPDSKLSTLDKIEDFQLLLDDRGNINATSNYAILGSNELYISEENIASLGATSRTYVDNYLWARNGFLSNSDNNWASYSVIYKTNFTISSLEQKFSGESSKALYRQVMGSAYFWRAFSYFDLAQSYCLPFDSATMNETAGIPLRTSTDITAKVERGNLREVYNLILSDFKTSVTYLQDSLPLYRTRPSKVAAYAMLMRVYLTMDDFKNALNCADSALKYSNKLLDFNTLNVSATASLAFPNFTLNPEVFLSANAKASTVLNMSFLRIDSTLYNSYDADDLRKNIYFRKREATAYSFRGTYDGTSDSRCLTAPAVDELYFTKAECLARLGSYGDALSIVNLVLAKRWKTGKFIPFVVDPANMLSFILRERGKELVLRSTHWLDLRRLNKTTQFATTITRKYAGANYVLLPKSNLYAWPIPQDEVLYSGIAQNPR